MDNDLMARRLRPPSQPNSSNGTSNGASSQQPTSPWEVPLTADGDFAPSDAGAPPQDPPFFPPDPSARADVPWDRPAPEVWPPTDDNSPNSDEPQIWSSQGPVPEDGSTSAEWPVADQLTEAAADSVPWDRPAVEQVAQWQDPDDALAPVVGDVANPVAWASWNDSDNDHGNGNGNGNGIGYASTQTPEPMAVIAQSDHPTSDEPLNTAGSNSYPEWPAEDELILPSPSGGAVMPEDQWPVAPPVQPAAPTPPTPPAAEAEPEQPAWLEPPDQPAQEPEVPTVPSQTVPSQPDGAVPSTPKLELSTPPNTHIVAITPTGPPENMVLRIELAIVHESQQSNPADIAKRVGPDADVRSAEHEPVPEPEYVWSAPSPAQPTAPPIQPQQPQEPQQPQQHAPSQWLPAPRQTPQLQNAQSLDWDLPQIDVPQPPVADPPAPWSTPQRQQPAQQPHMAPPTWAMTPPTPPYQPELPPSVSPPAPEPLPQPAAAMPWMQPPAQYPSAGQWQQAQQPNQPAAPQTWPPQQRDPLAGMPAAPQYQAQRAPQLARSAPMAKSGPATGSRARTGEVAADQADLWFLNNQPAAATVVDEDVHTAAKSNSVLTAGLTIGFALLVIVLVLVFIQLMTSLLR